MKNKKGIISIGFIIMITIAAVLLSVLLIPFVKQGTNTYSDTDNLDYVNGSLNQTFTLQYNPVVASSFSISGLTENTNYTVNYNAGTVKVITPTTANNYTAVYSYTNAGYMTNAGDRTLFGVISIIAIAGLLIYVATGMGLL